MIRLKKTETFLSGFFVPWLLPRINQNEAHLPFKSVSQMKQNKLFIILILCNFMQINGQDTIKIKELFKIPRRSVTLPIQYDLSFPSNEFLLETLNSRNNIGYNNIYQSDRMRYQYSFDNQVIRLDSSTIIQNPKNLMGTWRSISIRYIEIRDSISTISNQIFRHDSILGISENMEYIMMFNDNKFYEFKKKGKKTKYHTNIYDFQLVDGRILNFSDSKIFKSTQFIGIDKNDVMIMQYIEVYFKFEEGLYKIVNTRIGQMFFERISCKTIRL